MFTLMNHHTEEDIKKILNSGVFMTSTKRKLLQDRLEFLRKNNVNVKVPTKLDIKDFPMVGPTLVESTQKTLELNYSNIISDNQSPTKNQNIIDIDYQEVIDLFDYFAIYRLKLYQNTLRQKIHLLNEIQKNKNPLGNQFKLLFEYEKMVNNEKIISTCILICTGLYHLSQKNDLYINNEIKKLLNDLTELEPNIKQYIEKFEIDNLIEIFQNNLINYFDLKYSTQKVEYLVNIIRGKMIPIAVYSTYIVDCNDEINCSSEYDIYEKYFLKNITSEQLHKIFNQKLDIADYNNLFLISINGRDFYVRYEADSHHKKVQIINNGVYVPCLVSYVSEIKTNQKDQHIYNFPKINKKIFNNWLRRKINDLYYIDEQEYQNLDQSLQNAYSLEETHQNIFYIDYIFNHISQQYPSICRPQMLSSFKQLAFETSRI